MIILGSIENITITKLPILLVNKYGGFKMKMNMGGASFAVQLTSYHVGLIKHMMKKFMLNTVHSVHGKLYI